MKKLSFSAIVCLGLSLYCLSAFAQTMGSDTQKYQLQDYNLGAMLVGVRIPGNWDAAPIIIGKVDDAGTLTFHWPVTVPDDLKNATDQLNYVIQTGNCDPDENGVLENTGADYFLFNRIWLMHPETKEVQGQLMAASNDDLRKWMHRPDDEKAATGTYAYLLYAFKDNTLRSTCQFESWITPEGQDEITLHHKFENNLKVIQGFQFIIYNTKEVHPFEGVQPKIQEASSSPALPEGIIWKVKN